MYEILKSWYLQGVMLSSAGLIEFLLGESDEAQVLRDNIIFKIGK